jgi:voltage-gated potassium channel
MKRDDGDRAGTEATPWELFILALSVMSLVNFALLLLPLADTTKGVLLVMDAFLCLFFLVDFGVQLQQVPSRGDYFFRHLGWLDLLGSLPFPALRLFRVIRVVRIVRTFRRNGGDHVWRQLVRRRAEAALLFVMALVSLTLEAGALGVLWAESHAPQANIKDASDALWWCLVTITSVGYGDRFPVTNGGRLVGALLMIVGVGLVGTFTAFVANFFIAPGKGSEATAGAEPDMEEIRALLGHQEEVSARLRQRVDAVDAQLRATAREQRRAPQ